MLHKPDYTRIVPLYDSCISDCLNILNDANVAPSHQIVFDLFAMLYTSADFAVFSSYGNRNESSSILSDAIANRLSYMYHTNLGDILAKRVEFYGHIMSGMSLHALCLIGDDIPNQHPLTRCILGFTDCCLFPDYITDYNAAKPMLSILQCHTAATTLYFPLLNRISQFYKDISEIVSP